jgi:hypothetical protein
MKKLLFAFAVVVALSVGVWADGSPCLLCGSRVKSCCVP